MALDPENLPKGNPEVVSDTEGEEITPDNPEVVRQNPTDTPQYLTPEEDDSDTA